MVAEPIHIPRPEYPRPQFVRDLWLNLNGEWEFAFDDNNEGLRVGWHDGRQLPLRIIVPFAYQTELSGINDKSIHECVWYARTFEVLDEWQGQDLLLNFGAVEQALTTKTKRTQSTHREIQIRRRSANARDLVNPTSWELEKRAGCHFAV